MKILIFFIFLNAYAIAQDDPEAALKKQMSYYEKEYPGYLKEKYELDISELYWRRIQDFNILGQAFSLRANDITDLAEKSRNEFYKIYTSNNFSYVEKISLLKSHVVKIQQLTDEVNEYLFLVNELSKKISLACTESQLNDEAVSFDPKFIYPIPQYSFKAGQAPSINMSVYFAINYNTDGGYMGANGNFENQDLNEEQQAFIYTGAAIITGVAMFFGVADPTALSAIFAGSVQVLTIISSFVMGSAAQDEYDDQMRKLTKMYDELNSDIYQVHIDLNKDSKSLFEKYCLKSMGKKEEDAQILTKYYQQKNELLSNTKQQLEGLYNEINPLLVSLENSILNGALSDIEFLTNYGQKVETAYIANLEKLFQHQLYLDQEAFSYFITKPAKSISLIKKAEKIVKRTNLKYQLWDQILVGDAKFDAPLGARSINWSSYKKQVQDVIEGDQHE